MYVRFSVALDTDSTGDVVRVRSISSFMGRLTEILL